MDKEKRLTMIYQSFINTREYDKINQKAALNLSWLENKLDYKDLLKLEEAVTSYTAQNEKNMFESGFVFAWELFQECKEKVN